MVDALAKNGANEAPSYQAVTGGALGFRSVNSSGNLLASDANKIVRATAGAGGITLTLPDPTTVVGTPIYVKKVDSDVGVVTIAQFAGETIDGSATVGLASQWQLLGIVSDGTNWILL